MSALGIASIVFACVFGAAMLGVFVGGILPEQHRNQETKDVVKLGTGMIATMAALILSLLVSSAKNSFDVMGTELLQNAARALTLDRALADYGPEAAEVRALMKRALAARVALMFSSNTSGQAKLDTPEQLAGQASLVAKLWALSPQTDAQRACRSQALDLAAEMSSTRWMLILQKDQPIPVALIVVLVIWLSIVFVTFGLFAPRNATAIGALFVCALSVSGAILLIQEMNSPFTGLIRISDAPLRDAVARMGQ